MSGNTGPFWIGSGVALLSAFVTLVFIKPLSAEGMEREDRDFREYLEANGFDTSGMGLLAGDQVGSIVDEHQLVEMAQVSIEKNAALKSGTQTSIGVA
ncbi:hypothetical protein H0H87_000909 [Tephrocybe sp. NHM501043]|nr:hypothetical protein H0H87_000909 [Tephrocybe sp. NHM501043]